MTMAVKTERTLDVASNMGLVHQVAHRFRWAIGSSLEFEDLVQAGAIGLMRALDTFDPERGFAFSTYASHWVRQSIRRVIANQRRTVRVPVHAQEAAWRLGAPIPLDAFSLDAPMRRGDSTDSWLEQLTSEDHDPTRPLDVEQRSGAIARAMAQLPERTRSILEARYWGDQTLQQIGEGLNVTRERVRQVCEAGLDAIRARMKEAP